MTSFGSISAGQVKLVVELHHPVLVLLSGGLVQVSEPLLCYWNQQLTGHDVGHGRVEPLLHLLEVFGLLPLPQVR